MTCHFCGTLSPNRDDYNEHLASCEENTVPCRPGYMCDACGHVGATPRQLRQHLETEHSSEAVRHEDGTLSVPVPKKKRGRKPRVGPKGEGAGPGRPKKAEIEDNKPSPALICTSCDYVAKNTADFR